MESIKKVLFDHKFPLIYIYDSTTCSPYFVSTNSNEIDIFFSDKSVRLILHQQFKKVAAYNKDPFIFHDPFGLSYFYINIMEKKKELILGGWVTSKEQNNLWGENVKKLLCKIPEKKMSVIQDEFQIFLKEIYMHLHEEEMSLTTKVERYLLDDLSKRYTLEQISEVFYCSQSTIKNKFIEEKGMSFRKYSLGLRMEKAKELFDYPSITEDEIAKRLGYKSAYALRRAYKNYFGE